MAICTLVDIMHDWRWLAKHIAGHGGQLYVVGGTIRDFFMQRPSKDVDFCVTGLTKEQFMNLFPNARIQGKSFPVFVTEGSEFAMARTELKTAPGYCGFDVDTDPSITIEQDLFRRDLTINSMAINVITGELTDPYGGLIDLSNKKLRATSGAFYEDPVRALRVARIAAETGFTVDQDIYRMIANMRQEISLINNDMKLKEFKKAIVGKYPWKYIDILKTANVLYIVFPEINALFGIPQAHHTDGSAGWHTMRVLLKCRELTDNPIVLTAALLHDVGKATTPKEMLPAHHDHEKRSVEIIEQIDWLPKEYKKDSIAYAFDHMRGHRFREMKRGKRVSLIERILETKSGLDGFCKLLYADHPTEETLKTILAMKVTAGKMYSISGIDLPSSTPQGELFGQVLHQKRAELLDD